MNILGTVLYCITFCLVFFGVIFIKKSDKEQSFIVWLPVSFFVILCADAFLAGLLSLVHIPINLFTTAAINIVGAGVLWFFILFKEKRQQTRTRSYDYIALAVSILVVIACGLLQFGTGMQLHYATSDPSIHLYSALGIVDSQAVSGMYLAHYFIAMLIEAISPFVSVSHYYYALMISDLIFLFMSSLIFYAITNRFIKVKYSAVAVIGLMVLYTLAYPLNNMVFGFCYLGVSVSVVGALVFVGDGLLKHELSRLGSLIFCMLFLFGLIISYSLFVPFVYVAFFINLLLYFKRQNILFKKGAITSFLLVFLPPIALGFLYSYLSFFGNTGVTVSGAIANEGFIYRDLYSNFVITAPFFIYGLYLSIKNREWAVETVLFVVLFVTIAIALFVGLAGIISSYYFYKFYYLFWLASSVLAARGLAALLASKQKALVVTYCTVWIVIMLLAATGLDQKLHNKNIYFDYKVKAWEYLDIYRFNLDSMRDEGNTMPNEKIELYDQAEMLSSQGSAVPLASDWFDIYWYQAMTDQDMQRYYPWAISSEEYVKNLADCRYIAVIRDSEEEVTINSLFDNHEVVYANSLGYIIKVN